MEDDREFDEYDEEVDDFDSSEYPTSGYDQLHEAHGFFWESSRDYAEFLADYLGYDHDEIDYWLGYTDD